MQDLVHLYNPPEPMPLQRQVRQAKYLATE